MRILLLMIMSSNSFASLQALRNNINLARIIPFQQLSLFHTQGPSNKPSENKLSEEDLEQIDQRIAKHLDSFYKKRTDDAPWGLPYAQGKMIEHFENQGVSSEEARDKFLELDNYVDRQRVAWNIPHYLTFSATVASMPVTYLLVYNEQFYSWVLQEFPWLEHTSWDWAEPLVQSLLTTQTQFAIAAACAMALGIRPYSRFRDAQLVKKIAAKWDVPVNTAKRFIKVDK